MFGVTLWLFSKVFYENQGTCAGPEYCHQDNFAYAGDYVDATLEERLRFCWNSCEDLYGEQLLSVHKATGNTLNTCCCIVSVCHYLNNCGEKIMLLREDIQLPENCENGCVDSEEICYI